MGEVDRAIENATLLAFSAGCSYDGGLHCGTARKRKPRLTVDESNQENRPMKKVRFRKRKNPP